MPALAYGMTHGPTTVPALAYSLDPALAYSLDPALAYSLDPALGTAREQGLRGMWSRVRVSLRTRSQGGACVVGMLQAQGTS